MKFHIALTLGLFGLLLIATHVHAGCDSNSKESEDGDVKSWFKNLGCKIQKGAEDLQEQAKPWADKVASTTKEFGSTVAQKYGEIKHKLTDDEKPQNPNGETLPALAPINAPTEKVPLAPLSGDVPLPSAVPSTAPTATVTTSTATGEQKTEMQSINETTTTMPRSVPESIVNRFLLQQLDCPKGEVLDHRNMCRPQA